MTRRNRVDNTVNIKAEVETSLLEDMQLQYGVVLQLHFAENMNEGERKMCLSHGRYTSVAAASTTSLLVLPGPLS